MLQALLLSLIMEGYGYFKLGYAQKIHKTQSQTFVDAVEVHPDYQSSVWACCCNCAFSL
jgi:hypothetical protein